MKYKLYLERDNEQNVVVNAQGKPLLNGKEQIWLWANLNDGHIYNEHWEDLGHVYADEAMMCLLMAKLVDAQAQMLGEHFQFRRDMAAELTGAHRNDAVINFGRLMECNGPQFTVLALLLYQAVLDLTGFRLIYLDAPNLPFDRRDIFGMYAANHDMNSILF